MSFSKVLTITNMSREKVYFVVNGRGYLRLLVQYQLLEQVFGWCFPTLILIDPTDYDIFNYPRAPTISSGSVVRPPWKAPTPGPSSQEVGQEP